MLSCCSTVERIKSLLTGTKLTEFLNALGKWDFDIFEFTETTNGHPLIMTTLLALYGFNLVWLWDMLYRHCITLNQPHVNQPLKLICTELQVQEFNIPIDKLLRFLKTIEDLYNDVPYHNKIHAADIVHSVYWFLSTCGVAEHLTKLEIFTCIMAACSHDVEHPGLNNNFQKQAGKPATNSWPVGNAGFLNVCLSCRYKCSIIVQWSKYSGKPPPHYNLSNFAQGWM